MSANYDEMIAVLTAAKEGKKIQYRSDGEAFWHDSTYADNLSWNFACSEYRIKPQEPRRIWVNCYPQSNPAHKYGGPHDTKEQSMLYRESVDGAETNEFIELTPEVRAKLGL